MDERELFHAYRATVPPAPRLELLARAAMVDLWARGGVRGLRECPGGCGTLLIEPRVWCRVCLMAERARRRAPGEPGALLAAAGGR